MSVGADRVFDVSDPHPLPHPIAFLPREGDTDRAWYSTLCMYLLFYL